MMDRLLFDLIVHFRFIHLLYILLFFTIIIFDEILLNSLRRKVKEEKLVKKDHKWWLKKKI